MQSLLRRITFLPLYDHSAYDVRLSACHGAAHAGAIFVPVSVASLVSYEGLSILHVQPAGLVTHCSLPS